MSRARRAALDTDRLGDSMVGQSAELWATARRMRRCWRSATAFSWNSAGAAASRAGSERFCSRTSPTDRTSKLSRSANQNKGASTAAEPVERRGGAKENADLQSTVRTQSREAVSQAQARIRKVVTRNRQWPEKRFLSLSRGGARCVSSARRDLCGGCSVMSEARSDYPIAQRPTPPRRSISEGYSWKRALGIRRRIG